jgi:hypothetical protein
MAWLHTTPKPPEGTVRAKHAARISRYDQAKRDGIEPPMPPNPMPHLIGHLIEAGITQSTGMDRTPLSWCEIEAWQRTTHARLSVWEVRLLRKLSLAYVSEGRRAEDENCPAPWRGEVTQAERVATEAALRRVLG